MRIVLIYRKPLHGVFSIETLFNVIASQFRILGHEVIEYRLRSRWHLFFDIVQLRVLAGDIYHVTGAVHYILIFLIDFTKVLTIHDIGHYLYNLRGWKKWIYRWIWLCFPMQVTDLLTVVSESTRQDLIGYLGVEPDRVKVIENCYNPVFKYSPKPFREECPFVLQVGTKPYKNVPRLIYALRGLPCYLALVGPLGAEISSALAETNTNYVSYQNLSEQELHALYLSADLVSFVSLNGEGFGIPIIEAQAVGRPVITSKFLPMCDVAGGAACLVDPNDVASIRSGIKRIIEDKVYREELIWGGQENVKRFSVETVARHYLDEYMELDR